MPRLLTAGVVADRAIIAAVVPSPHGWVCSNWMVRLRRPRRSTGGEFRCQLPLLIWRKIHAPKPRIERRSPACSGRRWYIPALPERRTLPRLEKATLLKDRSVGKDHDGRLLRIGPAHFSNLSSALPGPSLEHLC